MRTTVRTQSQTYQFRLLPVNGPYIFKRAVNKVQQQAGDLPVEVAKRVFKTYYCSRELNAEKISEIEVRFDSENGHWRTIKYKCGTIQ